MPRSEARDVPISLTKSLSVIGDPWTLHILKESFLGTRRFQDFQSRLGIPRQTLILRLRQMVINQLYYKKPVQHRRLIFEYRLTPKGVDLYSMILGVWRWHKHWHQTPHHLPEQLIHSSCGHQITPEFVCRSCTGCVKAGELSFAARFPNTKFAPPATRRTRIVNQYQSKAANEMVTVIVGDGWSLLVLNAIINRVITFDALQKALGISNNVLSTRIKMLSSLNLLTQNQSTTDKRMIHYDTTPMGKDVYPVIVSLLQWGDRWLAGDNGPADLIKHKPCGSIEGFVMVCDHCNRRLYMEDVRQGRLMG